MASSVGGDAGEMEWLKVAELRAMAEAQDPHVKVRTYGSLVNQFCFFFFDALLADLLSSWPLRERGTADHLDQLWIYGWLLARSTCNICRG
jgi:hypothetical protein